MGDSHKDPINIAQNDVGVQWERMFRTSFFMINIKRYIIKDECPYIECTSTPNRKKLGG